MVVGRISIVVEKVYSEVVLLNGVCVLSACVCLYVYMGRGEYVSA